MTHNLTIRLATLLDEPRLGALPFAGGMPDQHRNRILLQMQGHVAYILAEIGEEIVGFMLLKWNGPEDPFLKRKLPPCAEIENLVVAEAHRNHGIGAAMIAYAEATAREHGDTRIGLAASVGNTAARRLYERLGFAEQPDSVHRVSWFEPQADGTSRIAGEDCTYWIKDLR
jgi:ribosomal protein S18 acetylase RimI-like enzyme